MFAILPPFTVTTATANANADPFTTNPFITTTMAPAQSYNHRPSVSSPLSSPPPATGSARHSEFSFSHQRATQSSPVQQQHHQPQQQPFSSPPSQPANAKLFRYSQNPFRSGNPLTSVKRDQVRETKRKLFLANVRQRQEDKKWEKREDEVCSNNSTP